MEGLRNGEIDYCDLSDETSLAFLIVFISIVVTGLTVVRALVRYGLKAVVLLYHCSTFVWCMYILTTLKYVKLLHEQGTEIAEQHRTPAIGLLLAAERESMPAPVPIPIPRPAPAPALAFRAPKAAPKFPLSTKNLQVALGQQQDQSALKATEHQKELGAKDETIKSLQAHIANLAAAFAASQNNEEASRQEADTLRNRLALHYCFTQQLQQEKTVLASEVARLGPLASHAAALNDQVLGLQTANEEIKRENENIMKEKEQMAGAFSEATAKSNQLQNTVNELEMQLASSKHTTHQQESIIATLTEAEQKARGELEHQRDAWESREATFLQMQAENETLRRELANRHCNKMDVDVELASILMAPPDGRRRHIFEKGAQSSTKFKKSRVSDKWSPPKRILDELFKLVEDLPPPPPSPFSRQPQNGDPMDVDDPSIMMTPPDDRSRRGSSFEKRPQTCTKFKRNVRSTNKCQSKKILDELFKLEEEYAC